MKNYWLTKKEEKLKEERWVATTDEDGWYPIRPYQFDVSITTGYPIDEDIEYFRSKLFKALDISAIISDAWEV